LFASGCEILLSTFPGLLRPKDVANCNPKTIGILLVLRLLVEKPER